MRRTLTSKPASQPALRVSAHVGGPGAAAQPALPQGANQGPALRPAGRLRREGKGSLGGGPALRAMDRHQDDETVQEKACGALANLAVNDANKATLVAAGAHLSIM